MFGNMGLRAEMAVLEARIQALEMELQKRDKADAEWSIRSLAQRIRVLEEGPVFPVRQQHTASVFVATVPMRDVVRQVIEHLGLEAEEVQFDSRVRLVKKKPQGGGEK